MTTIEKKDKTIIGQGAYGCIYKPAIKCDRESEKYITKVQRLDAISKNEIEIGKKVKQLKNFDRYFAPIEKTCPLNISKVGKVHIERCDIWNNKNVFISNQIRYAGNNTLHTALLKYYKQNEKMFEKITVKTIMQLLHGLDKLNKHGIIHMDIKENNIMVKDTQPEPTIIDFGLSFNMNKFDKNETFFMYVYDYSPWTIDQTMISYMLNKIKNINENKITKSEIEMIIKDYSNNNNILMNNLMLKERFIKENKPYFMSYINKPWVDMYNELLKKSWSWDIHSLLVCYYSFFNYESYLKQRYKKVITFLENNIFIEPDKREKCDILISKLEKSYSIKSNKSISVKKDLYERSIKSLEKSILKSRISELKQSQKMRSKSTI